MHYKLMYLLSRLHSFNIFDSKNQSKQQATFVPSNGPYVTFLKLVVDRLSRRATKVHGPRLDDSVQNILRGYSAILSYKRV